MGLVCLGSCFFSMCGQIAFRSSTMGWDAARVAAAIPSGVGFLGAGLIWKGSVGGGGEKGDLQRPEVHGLTTAASVWLSSAVGVGISGRLFIVSFYAVVLVVLVLRLGPKMYFVSDSSYGDSDIEDDVETDEWDSGNDISTSDDDDDGESDGIYLSKKEQLRLLMGIKKEEYDDEQHRLEPMPIKKVHREHFRSAPNLSDLEKTDNEETLKGEELIPLVDHSSDAYKLKIEEGRGGDIRKRRTPHKRRRGRSCGPGVARKPQPTFFS
mmetsp:Transcript_7840/g.10008  ORF Transcript_7840/g.10008 Transcript_7840/m.10008 type:complete len:267 (+) Transcript_7840:353-1153(+)